MAAGEASSSGGGGEEASGSGSGSGTWTWEQDKAFEDALATLGEPDDEAAVWDWIALAVEGKTAEEVRRHYELLVEDVDDIESGRVPLLDYAHDRRGGGGEKAPSSAQQERRKGGTWTLEEHELFISGLEKHGKGDWKSISRNFVISRTPTQVASHAQKYYIRQNSENKKRRRPSILDITSVDDGEASAAQGTVTGTNGQAALPGKSPKQPTQPANLPPSGDAFGTTIAQPFGGPLVSAVGTPATLRVPAPPHMANGMHAPVPGTMVPRAPVPGTMVPRAPVPGTMAPRAPINIPYPMPPPSSRRWPPS